MWRATGSQQAHDVLGDAFAQQAVIEGAAAVRDEHYGLWTALDVVKVSTRAVIRYL